MEVAHDQRRAHTILIVDDTAENIALMSSVLQDSYRTKVAREGETALRVASMASPPDLILLDVMMPGMDGYEVCRRLKENPDTADIPVIFITARSDIEDERRGLDVGAVDYITKPISPPILAARVRTHLRLKDVRQERVPGAGGRAPDTAGQRDPGRDNGGAGLTGGDPRQ